MKAGMLIFQEPGSGQFKMYIMAVREVEGIKKAHHHTKKDTLQRLGADLYVKQALRMYGRKLQNNIKGEQA
jgi:hypothetical protein